MTYDMTETHYGETQTNRGWQIIFLTFPGVSCWYFPLIFLGISHEILTFFLTFSRTFTGSLLTILYQLSLISLVQFILYIGCKI